MRVVSGLAAVLATMTLAGPSAAQITPDQVQEQDSLKVYFETGSAVVGSDQETVLDQAARLFREGSPIVMIVAGGADTVGAPGSNLNLSVQRAQAVVDGLVARGIPASRLQLLGRGNSELAVETPAGVDSRENRLVEITWR